MGRLRLVVPALAGLAAWAGAALDAPALLVIAAAAAVGAVVEYLATRAADRRQHAQEERLTRLADDRFGELTAERTRIEALLDALPTAVLLFTAEGLAYANPAAQSLFGVGREAPWTPVRVLGTEALAQAVAEVRETGRPVEVEVRRDDRDLLVRATATDAAEVTAGTSGQAGVGEVALIATDVSDLRRVEALRRDFVANASHELKTPVAAMQALADSLTLAQDRDPARARTMVGRLQLEATRLARLVRDLLDLTRLEERDDVRRRQQVDLSGLAAAQVERLVPAAVARDVILRYVGEGGVRAVAVPEDLRLVVDNLVTNAIQYNQPGGTVTRRGRTRRRDRPADRGRHRDRDRRLRPRPGLRALLPRRQGPEQGRRRDRPGPVDRAQRGRAARGAPQRRQRAGRRLDVHRGAARRRGTHVVGRT